jgi:hypothetical protein
MVLPDEALGEKVYALANVSVADLRMGPDYAEEMGTQLLMGAPMFALREAGSWLQVRTPEGYIAWIQGGTITRVTERELSDWNTGRRLIVTADYAFGYEADDEFGARVSDLVFGNILRLNGERGRFYIASYPDGRQGFVLKSQAQPIDDWMRNTKLTGESIVRRALSLKGIPYTWGGTSVKALDCSGFAKTVYLSHGIILRRDASQQAKTGEKVDLSDDYSLLKAGDLLFFGKKATEERGERIRHVGIYIGNKEFIHAAGYVRVNSLDPTQPHYDEGKTQELVRAARIIGSVGSEGIQAMKDNTLYQ